MTTQSQPQPAEKHPLYPTATPFLIPTSTSPPVHIYGLTFGHGPPLLCLHGFPQTLAIYHKVAPTLSQHFTLVILDLRGYGRSSKPPSPSNTTDTTLSTFGPRPDWIPETETTSHALYSKRSMATDCLTVMQTLGHKTFHILSHDRGARVAHAICAEHPSAALSVLVLDIVPTLPTFRDVGPKLALAYYHWFFLAQPAPFPETLILGAPEAFARKQLLRLSGPGDADDYGPFGATAWGEYMRHFTDPETVHAWCEDYRAAAKEDCAMQMRAQEEGRLIQCPLGVTWGAKGAIGASFDPRMEWEEVCVQGGVRFARAVGCGHYIAEEAPEELLGVCEEFFGGVGVWGEGEG